MISEKLKQDVMNLSVIELKSGDAQFGPFKSRHEGESVIREELEETRLALATVSATYKELLNAVWENDAQSAIRLAEVISSEATYLAAEAIQVKAMAMKFVRDCND